MARIRSVKPEFWLDPKVARLSRDARMLYLALWNQSDEHGRLHGDPRVVKGQTFPYDDDLTPATIGALLDELASRHRVVRYVVDGDPYLFLPKLCKHQRLEPHKVPSRLPAPPDPSEFVLNPAPSESRAEKSAPRADESETIVVQQVAGGRWQVAGGREQVAGGREQVLSAAPRANDNSPASAQALVGEWIDHCGPDARPPKPVIGQVSKQLKGLLDEGIPYPDVRAGLIAWHDKRLHPSTLPSIVHEVRIGPSRSAPKRSTTDERVAQTLTDVLPRMAALDAAEAEANRRTERSLT